MLHLNTLSEQNKNIFEQKAVLYKYCASIIDSVERKIRTEELSSAQSDFPIHSKKISKMICPLKMCADFV